MSEVTSREQKELQEAREALRKPFDEALPVEAPAGTLSPEAPAPAPTEPVAAEGASQEEQPGTPVPGGTAAAPAEGQDYAKLRQEHEALQKQFKAIQASVTPVQQERSELRRRLQALEEELRTRTVKTPAGDSRASGSPLDASDLKTKLDALREVIPEAADLFEATLQENLRIKSEVDQRIQSTELQRQEELAKATMGELFRQRPTAQQLSEDPNFWAWIDAQGPESHYYREILKTPWVGDNFQATLSILDAYPGAPMGTPVPGASTPVKAIVPPPVAAPAPTAPRPTDMGVPTRGGALPNTQANPGKLTDSQIQEMDNTLRRGGQAQALDVVKRMRENWKLNAQR